MDIPFAASKAYLWSEAYYHFQVGMIYMDFAPSSLDYDTLNSMEEKLTPRGSCMGYMDRNVSLEYHCMGLCSKNWTVDKSYIHTQERVSVALKAQKVY